MRTDISFDALRNVKMTDNYLMSPQGSVLIEMGNTKVICTASVEDSTARHLVGTGKGWVTAEYGMLPRATQTRVPRELKKPSGRSQEIQRLIGRSLRAAVDLTKMKDICLYVDCDVIQADGGTRTASITGGFVALYLAIQKLMAQEVLSENPIREFVAAVSCDIYNGEAIVDVDYVEDSEAQVDMNFVMTESGKIIEIQGTAEGEPFSEEEFDNLRKLAKQAIAELVSKQRQVLGV